MKKQELIEKIKSMIIDDEKTLAEMQKFYHKRGGGLTVEGWRIHTYRMITLNRTKEILALVEKIEAAEDYVAIG